jgi:hypothetical protein
VVALLLISGKGCRICCKRKVYEIFNSDTILHLWVFYENRYGLWGMGELWVFIFVPANQIGKSENVWVIKKYGLSEVWVMRASTVGDFRKSLEAE